MINIIGGAIIVILSFFISFLYTRLLKQNEYIKSIFCLPSLPANSRRSNVIFLGLNSVGKTSIINALCQNDFSNKRTSNIITEDYQTIWKSATGNNIYVNFIDSPGDNLRNLITTLVQYNIKPYSPFKFGEITTIVLVVDFNYISNDSKNDSKLDEKRIKQHIGTWQSYILSVFLAWGNKNIEVVLFINKIDLLGLEKKALSEQFKEIKTAIYDAGARNIHIIEGSAFKGMGIDVLRKTIIDNAVPRIQKIQYKK